MKKMSAYIFLCFIWGTTWMAIKIGLKDLTPFFSLGLRYLIAGIFMLVYILTIHRKITVEKKQWKLIFLITLFNFIIPYGLVYWGEQFIFSDLTAVIFAMLPINVVILSLIFFKEEKINLINIVGILIGFSGIITIFYEKHYFRQVINCPGAEFPPVPAFLLILVVGLAPGEDILGGDRLSVDIGQDLGRVFLL